MDPGLQEPVPAAEIPGPRPQHPEGPTVASAETAATHTQVLDSCSTIHEKRAAQVTHHSLGYMYLTNGLVGTVLLGITQLSEDGWPWSLPSVT